MEYPYAQVITGDLQDPAQDPAQDPRRAANRNPPFFERPSHEPRQSARHEVLLGEVRRFARPALGPCELALLERLRFLDPLKCRPKHSQAPCMSTPAAGSMGRPVLCQPDHPPAGAREQLAGRGERPAFARRGPGPRGRHARAKAAMSRCARRDARPCRAASLRRRSRGEADVARARRRMKRSQPGRPESRRCAGSPARRRPRARGRPATAGGPLLDALPARESDFLISTRLGHILD